MKWESLTSLERGVIVLIPFLFLLTPLCLVTILIGGNWLEKARVFGLHEQSSRVLLRGILLFVAPSGIGVGGVAFRWVSRRARVRSPSPSPTTVQPAVILLRGFGDDRLPAAKQPLFFVGPGISVPFEEAVLSRFEGRNQICVALGRPVPRDAALIAERFPVTDVEWQAELERLLDRSARVVVIVGPGEGLAWEIALLRKRGRMKDAIFIVPPGKLEERLRRWTAVLPCLAEGHFRARLPPRASTWWDAVRGKTPPDEVVLTTAAELAQADVAALTFERALFRAWPREPLVEQTIDRILAVEGVLVDPRIAAG